MPLKVLGVIAVVVILLLCLPVGVDAGYCDGQLTIRLRLGAVTIGLYPTKPKKRRQKKQEPQPEAESVEEPPAKKRTMPDVTKEEILAAGRLLLRSIQKLKFRIRRLKLHFVSAFEDPYTTAMVYGYANAGVSALQLQRIKGADIQLGVDFSATQCWVDGEISVTIRIWYLMKFAVLLLVGGGKLFLQRKKRIKATNMGNAQVAGKET